MNAVRLVVDGRPLVGARTGIGVHTIEIASRLSLGVKPVIATHAPVDRSDVPEGKLDWVIREARPGFWWQQRHLPSLARRAGGDVLWGPHGTLPLMLDMPAVVTVHDLTSLDMPGRHKLKTILSFNTLIGPSLERAARIVAVSRHTAAAVERRFGVSSKKIEVIYNGVSDFFSPGADDEDLLDELDEFILCAGTIEPRKGLETLVSAWSSLAEPRPKLVLCGPAGWGSEALLSAIEGRTEIIRTGWVSRETLRALYRAAKVTVYPSLFEGFGLPVLEAMKCGSPVITTTGGAIPEVAGEAALLVEPGDARALNGAISTLLRSAELREELSEKGLAQADRFSWDRAVRSFEEIVRSVAGD